MPGNERDDELRRAALQTSAAILAVRRRAEQDLVTAKQALEARGEELARSIALLHATLESTPDGIVAMDLAGRVIASNQRFLDLWNLTPADLVAASDGRVTGHIAAQLTETGRFHARTDELTSAPETIMRDVFETRDGRTLERYVGPQRVGGQCVGVVMNWRDITANRLAEAEKARLLEAEQVARLEAEKANRSKDDFLATLSHELRTPLSTILGWAHILKSQANDPEKTRHAADVIQRNARVQVELINDLLDMSRIISGKLRLNLQPVSLPDVIEAAIETVRPAADARDIRIHESLGPETPPVSGDPTRLQQVFWNLLTNAIKFTPERGTVTVTLGVTGSRVEVSVADTGGGIDPALLPHVFERFRQGDSSTAREHGGLGIGLSVVKTLVELHGGVVHAGSEGAGKGTTFTVALPVPDAAMRVHSRHMATVRAGGSRETGEMTRLDGVKLLLVDDQHQTLEAISRILLHAGAEVATAESVEAALEEMAIRPPDILISDIAMPKRDGYELIRAVRASGSRIPAAALTAFASSEDRTKALVAGFDTHLSKPVEPGELLVTIAMLAARRRRS
ncbi:MAG: ATP-binding protein [Gammaproteobacteria bacterium]